MSGSSGGSGGGGGGIGRREVAVRCFAAEYDDASLEYSESDEERAPNYVVTPTGARVNRLFVVGVLTEVEQVSDDVLRGRVVDPTGAFVVYAGQYQPDAKTFLERAEPPAFVSVTGKARTFEPDDGDRVYTSIRPESINAVDADTRDRWTVQSAEHTIERVATFAAALEREERGGALQELLAGSGVEPALAAGIPRAIDHYGTSEAYLAAVREMALSAAEVVAGERDEVEPLGLAPDEGGSADVDLAGGIEIEAGGGVQAAAEAEAPAGPAGPAEGDEPSTGTVEASTDAETEEIETESGGTEDVTEADVEPDAGTESETGPAAEADAEPDATSTGGTAEPAGSAGTASDTTDAGESTEPAAGAASDTGDELGDFDDYGTDEEEATEREAAGADVNETDVAGADTAEADTAEAPVAGSDEMYELDEEERAAVEEEFGTEFSTGSEVAEPGEADIETPEPVEEGEEAAETERAAEEPSGDETESVSSAAPAAHEDESAAPGDEAGVETAEAEGQTAESEGQTDEDDAGAAETEVEEEDGAVASGGDGEVDLQDAVVDAMADLDDGNGADRGAVIEAVVDDHGADREAVEDAIQDALMGGRCYEPEDGLLKAI